MSGGYDPDDIDRSIERLRVLVAELTARYAPPPPRPELRVVQGGKRPKRKRRV